MRHGTQLAGVIGWPVAHSLSPRVHGYWLRQYGIDGAYVPLAVAPDRLKDALRGLRALGFRGANVTVPHKREARRAVDRLDPGAARADSVNTVTVTADGVLVGTSTDGEGFLTGLRAACPRWLPRGGPAVVVGAGGAARAVAFALLDAGVPEVRVANRTAARARELAAALGPSGTAVPWDERADALAGAGLLANATSLGMKGQPRLDLPLDRLPPGAVVSDLVYAPLETELLATARARGNPAVDGLGMLLHQARPGFAAWFGHEPEVTDELRAFVAAGL